MAFVGYGTTRLWSHPTEFVNSVRLRIMQPNLPQDDKFNYSAKAQVMDRYLRLSDRATGPQSNGVRDFTHLIWPEAAFPFFLTREPDALAQIAALLKPSTVADHRRSACAGRRDRAQSASLQFDLCDRCRRLDPRHL